MSASLTPAVEATLSAAVVKNPTDKATRLVYADYLEEQGRDDEALRQREVCFLGQPCMVDLLPPHPLNRVMGQDPWLRPWLHLDVRSGRLRFGLFAPAHVMFPGGWFWQGRTVRWLIPNLLVSGQALTRAIRLGGISRELWQVCQGSRLVEAHPTGASRYFRSRAARTAARAIRDWLADFCSPHKVVRFRVADLAQHAARGQRRARVG
jgi:uncharacterized protein (TIGR02996 family)